MVYDNLNLYLLSHRIIFFGTGGGHMKAHLVAGPSNNGREDSTGSVISGKSSLDQARAVVAHKGGSLIVVTHV